MWRTRLTLLGLAGVLLVGAGKGRSNDPRTAAGRGPEAGATKIDLQGTWAITSVTRDGAADPAQLGELVTFEGDKIIFQPAIPQFAAIS
jgi:hypothetical protein